MNHNTIDMKLNMAINYEDLKKEVDRISKSATEIEPSEMIDIMTNIYKYWGSLPDRDEFPRYKTGTVIDEEQSVRWNREEVERRNNLYADAHKKIMKQGKDLDTRMRKAILISATNYWNVNEKQAELAWNKAWYDSHDSGIPDVIHSFEDILDFIENVIKAN